MHASSSRKADAAMHEICGVRRIVPVRSIGHKKRQKELLEGRYIGRPAARQGRSQARIIPACLAPVQKRPAPAPCDPRGLPQIGSHGLDGAAHARGLRDRRRHLRLPHFLERAPAELAQRGVRRLRVVVDDA